jgi:sialate O-acetylesterase
MRIDAGRIRLKFGNRGSGLRAKGASPVTGERANLLGFTIAAADGRFVRALAYIDGADVIVYSERVPQPAAVRYDWGNTPDGNLYNAEGLPAVPFRTDRPF